MFVLFFLLPALISVESFIKSASVSLIEASGWAFMAGLVSDCLNPPLIALASFYEAFRFFLFGCFVFCWFFGGVMILVEFSTFALILENSSGIAIFEGGLIRKG